MEKEINSLEESIEIYLRSLDNPVYFNNVPYIFVEGPTDVDVYYPILNSVLLIINNEKYRFKIQSNRFIFNYFDIIGGDPYDEDKKIYQCDYVREVIKTYYKNNFNCLYCFGFFDRDFIEKLDSELECMPIACTSMHDIETNLINCYFPTILSKYHSYFDDAYDIFKFTFLASLLEKASLDVGNTDSTIKRIVKHNFSNKNKQKRLYRTYQRNFDFNQYLQNNYINSPIYQDIIEKFSSYKDEKEEQLNNFKNIFETFVERNDEKLMDEILRYCNGHVLVDLLSRLLKKDNLVNLLIKEAKSDPERIFNLDPLKKFKEYEIDTGLIEKR